MEDIALELVISLPEVAIGPVLSTSWTGDLSLMMA